MTFDIPNTISKINKSYVELSSLSNDELRNRFQTLRKQVIVSKVALDNILIEVFSIVKETMRRFSETGKIDVFATENDKHLSSYDYVKIKEEKAIYTNKWKVVGEDFTWKMIPYDEQFQGGIEIHRGKIIQMATGEGKTLVTVAPVILNALDGKGVHVMTVNDYLSRRDYEITRPIYSFLGLSVGCIEGKDRYATTKKEAYTCDITFGTTSDFIFDYLFDHITTNPEKCVQREHNFCIIDEADSILIDEAQTPHIISNGTSDANKSENLYDRYLPLVESFVENCQDGYNIDYVRQQVEITECGKKWLAKNSGNIWLFNSEQLKIKKNEIEQDDNLSKEQKKGLLNAERNRQYALNELQNILYQLLRALTVFIKDRDYIIAQNEIIIVDSNTGRPKPNHIWQHGLHEAVMAKEHIKISSMDKFISATISIKNYVSIYEKMAGMTGTALAAKDEFMEVYNCEIAHIPTHRPIIRKDLSLRVFKTQEAQQKAIITEISQLHDKHRPILIGVSSIRKSEKIAKLLANNGFKVQLLNAKSLKEEAYIISNAGMPDTITIATNVAGRGTDIKPSIEALANGGLAVIGVGIAASKRIDEQLLGRSGRQGNPGSSQFFVSLKDDIVTYLSEEEKKELENISKANVKEELDNIRIKELFYLAQSNEETENKVSRNDSTEKDDLIDKHRQLVYKTRMAILQNECDIDNTMKKIFPFYNEPSFILHFEENKEDIKKMALPIMGQSIVNIHSFEKIALIPFLCGREVFSIKCDFEKAVKDEGKTIIETLQKHILFSELDNYWIGFINKINTNLIPISEYENIRHEAFDSMVNIVKEKLLHAKIPIWNYKKEKVHVKKKNLIFDSATEEDIINLTDICPCGSGKAYYLCHGKIVSK